VIAKPTKQYATEFAVETGLAPSLRAPAVPVDDKTQAASLPVRILERNILEHNMESSRR
jgi:hypothetical protein